MNENEYTLKELVQDHIEAVKKKQISLLQFFRSMGAFNEEWLKRIDEEIKIQSSASKVKKDV